MFAGLEHAIAARNPIKRDGLDGTDALRLCDGPGDGFPDLVIDDFAGRWLVQTRGGFPDWLSGGSIHWKKLGDKEPPRWIAGDRLAKPFVIREGGLQYWVDFNAGYSQGFFLDQRLNRARVRRTGGRVLNCFAYTCSFGVAAAAGGAGTANIDLSGKYLDWGKRNYLLNGIDPARHRFLRGDVREWLKRLHKKGELFDLVILDPPTFSRNSEGEVFTIESGMGDLAGLCENLLGRNGVLLCSTNQRSLGAARFLEMIRAGMRRPWQAEPSPMPPDFTGEQYLKTWWLTKK